MSAPANYDIPPGNPQPKDHFGLLFKAANAGYKFWRDHVRGIRPISGDELIGGIYYALHVACKNFDPSRGLKPSTLLYNSCWGKARNEAKVFAGWKLSQTNLKPDGTRRGNPRPFVLACEMRRSKFAGTGVSDEQVDPFTMAERDDNHGLVSIEDREMLSMAMALLGDPYRSILKWRFLEDRTLDSIAQTLEITRERVRQLESKALGFLRRVLTGGAKVGERCLKARTKPLLRTAARCVAADRLTDLPAEVAAPAIMKAPEPAPVTAEVVDPWADLAHLR